MRTSNPALMSDPFIRERVGSPAEAMTVSGTVQKTLILLLCVVATSVFTWAQFFKTGKVEAVVPWMWGGIIGGLIASIVTIFKKEWAPITAPIYALLEGLFIGGISAVFEASYPGIVIQAAACTFGTLAAMLFVYQSGWIEVTNRFRLGVVAATGGIAIAYFITIILGFFGVPVPFIHGSGMLGIGFSLFVVAIAALNLVLDFDLIERGAKAGVPKYMEWYGAFALMVTLVWLYIEILRLLSKIRERR